MQKARIVGAKPSNATRSQSFEQIDILLTTGQITERQHQAATIFNGLRLTVYGRQREIARYMVQIHAHISSDDAYDSMLTDYELEELRDRREAAYGAAVDVVRKINGQWLEAARRVLLDGRLPDRNTVYMARRCFNCLADHWKLPPGADTEL